MHLLSIVSTFLAFLSCTGVFACECGFGTLVSSSPCLCLCPDPYSPPNCIYKTTEDQKLELTMSIATSELLQGDPKRFSASGILEALTARFPNIPSSLQHHETIWDNTSLLAVVLRVPSPYVLPMMNDVRLNATWCHKFGVLKSHLIIPKVRDVGKGPSYVLLRIRYHNSVLFMHVKDIGYFVGALLLLFGLLCTEETLFSGTDKKYTEQENLNIHTKNYIRRATTVMEFTGGDSHNASTLHVKEAGASINPPPPTPLLSRMVAIGFTPLQRTTEMLDLHHVPDSPNSQTNQDRTIVLE